MPTDNQRSATTGADSTLPPAVPPAFHWVRETWGFALRARPLGRHTQHLFTTSQLRLPVGGDSDRRRAWDSVATALGVGPDRLRRVRQVHGRAVRVIAAGDASALDPQVTPDGDAIVSNVAGLALAVVVADCVPVLLVDPRRGAAAAVHAGWRGTAAGVAGAAVAAMAEGWGSDPSDLVVAIGPSIGPADYEVGEPLLAAFRDAGHGAETDRWFSRREGRLSLDLWAANRDQLVGAGVLPDSISVAGISTFAYPGWLESYRRDGADAGRLIAAVVVPAA